MAKAHVSPGGRLRSAWRRLSPLPGGKWLFSRLIGWMAPYSGSIRPLVVALEPGYARLALADRRGVRNHLNSVHAVALANLAELTSGLAMLAALPDGARGIPIALSITFVKKARGRLTAESRVALPEITADCELELEASIADAGGDVVARASVRWRVGPVR